MFRTRAEVAHSKAQGVVARAYANAQRGVVGTPDDLRELDEAQRVVRSTDGPCGTAAGAVAHQGFV